MGKLKYQQLVSATITRIDDKVNNKYYFVRNDTKIIFGNGKILLGSVIMTNPGSFDFKNNTLWNDFVQGKGSNTFHKNNGHPDSTMINIIKVIEEAYKQVGREEINGYVNIYNLSSAKCANGKEALECHNSIKKLINENNMSINLLADENIYNKEKFINMCRESNFVMIGFLKNLFVDKVHDIERLIMEANIKNIAQALDDKNWSSHPMRWIREKKGYLEKRAIENLYEIIK